MKFELFNDSGVRVIHNDITDRVFVRGRYSRREAEQWVEAANKVAEALPQTCWRNIRDIVNQNIVFDHN